MKITTGLPAHDLNAVGPAAKAIEERGFTGVSTQENRQDAFLPLAVAAIELNHQNCAPILLSRRPQSHGGRKPVLGYSARQQGAFHAGYCVRSSAITWRFSVFGHRRTRMREYVQALRAIQTLANGTKLDYHGEHYQFSLMTRTLHRNFVSTACPRCKSPRWGL